MMTQPRMLKDKNRRLRQGFALPTVLIASVVMLAVLAVSVSATASIRATLKTQYYTQLAQAAGDAGVAYAKACLAANNNVPTWTDAKPLTPATDCNGEMTLNYASVEALVVAGGGSGGGATGGGGAGGGVLYQNAVTIGEQSYSVVVGNGGAIPGNKQLGVSGSNSSFKGITATGGGGGGYSSNTGVGAAALSGGSGGGGVRYTGPFAPGTGIAGQGYAGRTPTTSYTGGGGGAGGVGLDSSTAAIGGTGGPGISNSITGSAVLYGGGGGGGGTTVSVGGTGGGGIGGEIGTAGTANTGGGGGGGWSYAGGNGGAGGKGVVIIAYDTSTGISATGGTISYPGTKTVHTFNTSDTFNVSSAGAATCPTDPRCSVMAYGDTRSSFKVGLPTTDANGKAVTIPNNGYVELLRSSTGAVWKTYNQPTAQAAVVPDLCSGSATGALGWTNAAVTTASLNTPNIDNVDAIALNSSNQALPGPQYFRKDFSITKSGTYTVSAAANATYDLWVDDQKVIDQSGTATVTQNISLGGGCHTVIASLRNGSNAATGSELRVSIKKQNSSNVIVKTDSSWRVAAGNSVSFSDPRYYESTAWGAVRDINFATAYSGSWTTASGDAWARYISTTHSLSGSNYPAAKYAYFRDYQDLVVSSTTQVNLTTLCDDQCEVFLDGNLVQKSIGSTNLFTSGITLSEGSHRFAVRLYNSTLSVSGFALSVVRSSDGTILTDTNPAWLAANAWTSTAEDYSSYSKDFNPNPSPVKILGKAELLVVAGGGSGGTSNASNGGSGGGGAGGLIYDAGYLLTVGLNYPVSIGAGGVSVTPVSTAGNNGQNSVFGSLLAIGGGGGARSTSGGGLYGGSGGGGGFQAYSGSVLGGGGVAGQGNRGGASVANNNGGGGGGAGGVGANTNPSYVGVAGGLGGVGGSGLTYTISGSSVTYARGGDGSQSSTNVAQAGAANTGNGGSSAPYGGAVSGAGGSGVVIVRILASATVTTTGSPSITTDGSYKVYKFTGSGSFKVTAMN